MIMLNGEKLAFETYPNGETRVDGERILDLAGESNRLVLKYENDGDLIKLMFVKRFLDDHRYPASLYVYYMPYSRMDRVEGASVFTLKYAANFLNGLNFEQVTVVEPHSDVTPALIDRSSAKYPTVELLDQVVRDTGFDPEKDYLFFPDAGAQKRYGKVKGFRQLVGFKERDFRSGEIRRLDIVGSVDKPGFKAIIVDDLCSYGGTFLLSAEKLREIGAAEVYLLVSHCENSIRQGRIPQSNAIDRIYTTDTMLDPSDTDLIHIYPIGGF
ncbi:ribose-phosphate pyrophosphokinase [Cohnella zeiphila]|uniref:Ribose-phosphate pyrophosphokinase n=1 Tax=Cohnella zeiphila TaxID=2761120 RepID=A0A7X0SIS2_9BACL|nr:ribose-phosphate pyrophosphokinase [Cohnella zeiphila]MBB6730646.1 ribose-phosphate pyrophosphokinase [Cohnella zeiphila]